MSLRGQRQKQVLSCGHRVTKRLAAANIWQSACRGSAQGGCCQRFAFQRLRLDSGSFAPNPLSGQRFVALRPWVVLQRSVACFAERFSAKVCGRDMYLTLPPEVVCAISCISVGRSREHRRIMEAGVANSATVINRRLGAVRLALADLIGSPSHVHVSRIQRAAVVNAIRESSLSSVDRVVLSNQIFTLHAWPSIRPTQPHGIPI